MSKKILDRKVQVYLSAAHDPARNLVMFSASAEGPRGEEVAHNEHSSPVTALERLAQNLGRILEEELKDVD